MQYVRFYVIVWPTSRGSKYERASMFSRWTYLSGYCCFIIVIGSVWRSRERAAPNSRSSINSSVIYKQSHIKLQLTRDRLRSFIRSFIRSFVHSFIRLFIRSFIRSFIRLFDLVSSISFVTAITTMCYYYKHLFRTQSTHQHNNRCQKTTTQHKTRA